jgi:hypothetical protein
MTLVGERRFIPAVEETGLSRRLSGNFFEQKPVQRQFT